MLLLCLLLQDSALVADLGAPEPETRDRAEAALLARGAAAYDALHKAASDPDDEVRLRARRLLDDPAFLLERTARGHWEEFAAPEPDRVAAAVKRLLELDRARVAEALGKSPLRFRAAQLRAILTGTPTDGLLYGVVLLEKSWKEDQPLAAIEVWVNASSDARSYDALDSSLSIWPLDPDARVCWVRSSGASDLSTFALGPGGVRVKSLTWSWKAPAPGRYRFSTAYRSSADYRRSKAPADLWTGRIPGGPVEFGITRM